MEGFMHPVSPMLLVRSVSSVVVCFYMLICIQCQGKSNSVELICWNESASKTDPGFDHFALSCFS